MLFFIFKIILSLFIIINNTQAYEKKLLKKAKFNEWEVYVKSDDTICYTISKPQKMEGEYSYRGRVDAVVAINTKIKNKYYVGFDFGYYFSNDQKVKLIIDNDSVFEINTFSKTAWINSHENPNLDVKIIEAMKKGRVLITEGRSKRGTDTKDTYSLIGFTKALKKVKDVCK